MKSGKRTILNLACVFLSMTLAVLAGGCAQKTFSADRLISPYVSESVDNWQKVSDENIVLENDSVRWDFSAETTHFSVTDKRSGAVYDSVPQNTGEIFSEEVQQRIASELSLVYYDSDSAAHVMTSNGDSVSKELHTVYRKGNSVRVIYTFGETEKLLVPIALPQKVFEDELCNTDVLDSGVIRRIKRYYTLLSPEDAGSEEFEEAAKQIPALEKQPLYVVKNTVDTLKKMEIDDACRQAGFTAERYAKIAAQFGIREDGGDEPGFTVPVQYTLNTDGFSAKVLTDLITQDSDSFTLTQIDLLEFFACADSQTEGMFLVPDGTGALIDFNRISGSYSQPIYGADAAVQSDVQTQLAQDALLPVFGITRPQGGILAAIESGAATATVHANTVSDSSPMNNAYFTFGIRAMDVTDIGTSRNIPVYNLYSKHFQYEHPAVRYMLLTPNASDYVGMAQTLRAYYIAQGLLPQTAKQPTSWMADYTCAITTDATFLGVPYTKRTVISTLEKIESQLTEDSLPHFSVRLLGWTKNGLAAGVQNEVRLYRKVGTDSDLRSLAKTVAKNGGRLYLEADFQTVFTDTAADGYSLKGDTAKYINRSLVQKKRYDTVTRQYVDSDYSSYLVSPTRFVDFADGFCKSLAKKDGADAIGLSFSSAGSLLYGDYAKSKDFDRCMSRALTEQALEKANERPILTEKGYLYALKDSTVILKTPIYSSGFDISAQGVPFYQMVVHGSVSYFSSAVNLSSDVNRLKLRSLEYGAGFYWSLMIENDRLLSGTDYETALYSMSAAENASDYKAWAEELSEYLKTVENQPMTQHRCLAENVYETVYANGAGVAVNYGDRDYKENGMTVPAGGYRVWLASKTEKGVY